MSFSAGTGKAGERRPHVKRMKQNTLISKFVIIDRRSFHRGQTDMANEDLSKLRIDKSGATPSRTGKNKTIYAVLAVIFTLILGAVSFRTIISPAVGV